MSSSTLLGTKATTKLFMEDNSVLAPRFTCDVQTEAGAVVKLLTNGKVTPVTAATDTPFGIVSVGNKLANEQVTVNTFFMAVMLSQADGAVDEGQLLNAVDYDTTTELNNLKVAADDTYAIAVALEAAVDNATFRAGYFRVPVKVLAGA